MSVLDFQCSRINPSIVGGTLTSIKYFPRPSGNQLVASSQPVLTTTNAAGALWVPVGPAFGGKIMTVRAAGNYGSDTGEPSGTVSFGLYPVTGTAANPIFGISGNSTPIARTGAITPTIPYEPWTLTAELFSDSSSAGNDGILIGKYEASYNGSIVADTTLIGVLTGLDWTVGNPALQKGAVLGFVIGVTFGTSDKSNIAKLTQFTISTD